MRRPGTPGPRGGGLYVSELQRARLLDAAFALVAERGYRRMAVRGVAERAGVSPKTFYDLFTDREDCFLAAFDYAVDELSAVARPVYEGESGWAERVRAGLGALLELLDREPALCRLVFVEALGAGPRVLARRAQVLEQLEQVIDEGRAGGKSARPPQELPPLTAEGIVSATFGVIHARLLQSQPEPLTGLLSALMATIVLPYRGRTAAARELARPALKHTTRAPRQTGGDARHVPLGQVGSRPPADFRLTVRTHAVLAAVAELGRRGSGPSNREVSDLVRVADQGQISRLMGRLQEQGLVENAGGQIQGVAKAWRLTPRGEEIVRVGQPRSERTNGRSGLPGVKR
jgi:AcrR family transcriptional regulator/DNA-binding MarR family transcriptional regulator